MLESTKRFRKCREMFCIRQGVCFVYWPVFVILTLVFIGIPTLGIVTYWLNTKSSVPIVTIFSAIIMSLILCTSFSMIWAGECAHTTLPVDEAAQILFSEQNGRNIGLPEQFHGVWWMSDNPGPELLANLDAFHYFPDTRTIVLHSGLPMSWSHNVGPIGWIGWLVLKVGYFLDVKVHIKFNKEFTYAEMPKTWLGGVPFFNGQRWTMKYINDNTWERKTYFCCSPVASKRGSYRMKKVIDGKGRKLPAFKEMIESIESLKLVKGTSLKTPEQVINIRRSDPINDRLALIRNLEGASDEVFGFRAVPQSMRMLMMGRGSKRWDYV